MGVSHEYERHRVFSFAQESTRYCNYSKDKFDNELTFIIPCWLDLEEGNYSKDHDFKHHHIENGNSISMCGYSSEENEDKIYFLYQKEGEYINNWKEISKLYLKLLSTGESPQQARSVLPNSLKTELVMTGFISDWKGFFALRDAPTAHPQAFELAHPLHEEFKRLNLL